VVERGIAVSAIILRSVVRPSVAASFCIFSYCWCGAGFDLDRKSHEHCPKEYNKQHFACLQAFCFSAR
jgi:hypothetical protein